MLQHLTAFLPVRAVCVYCGSSNHIDQSLKKVAHDVGRALGEKKIKIVYGGGRGGLMGPLADSALEEGGEVVGIIPEFIRSREIQHTGLTELQVVDSMHARKSLMVERSDAFIVLPGRLGTMDETFEILTWKQLGLHTKPIILFNHNNFWSHLLDLLDHIVARKFATEDTAQLYTVVEDIDGLFSALAAPAYPAMDPATKWF